MSDISTSAASGYDSASSSSSSTMLMSSSPSNFTTTLTTPPPTTSTSSSSSSSGTLPQVIVTDKGTFQLGPTIGKGGFGVVYQGLHVDGGAFVAIKQFKFDSGTEEQKKSLMAEIELLRSLNHPNIVHYITYSITGKLFNIVMEYVENGSLLKIRDIFGKLPETLVAVYMSQVLVGLVYLHEQGVIHRDIKGANLLVTKDGTIKIADFGISSKLGSTSVEDVNGTPYWMAPEIIELNGATPKSDIWSVGCTVIELLTGEPPYADLAPVSVLFHIVQDEHPPLPEGISVNCKDWLLSALKKDPNQRSSAKELLEHKWLKDAKESQEKSQISLGMDGAKRFVSAAKSIRKSVILKRKSVCMDMTQNQDGYAEILKEIAAQDSAVKHSKDNDTKTSSSEPTPSSSSAISSSSSSSRGPRFPKTPDSKKPEQKEPLLSLE